MINERDYSSNPNRYQGGPVGQEGPRPATVTETFANRLHGIATNVTEATEMCRANANRLCGGEPELASKSGPQPVPSGSLGAIEENMRVLEGCVAQLVAQVERFNNV